MPDTIKDKAQRLLDRYDAGKVSAMRRELEFAEWVTKVWDVLERVEDITSDSAVNKGTEARS